MGFKFCKGGLIDIVFFFFVPFLFCVLYMCFVFEKSVNTHFFQKRIQKKKKVEGMMDGDDWSEMANAGNERQDSIYEAVLYDTSQQMTYNPQLFYNQKG